MSSSGKAFEFKLFKRIASYIRPYRRLFISSVFITILLAVISPLRPWLIQYAFDHYIVTPDSRMLLNMILLLVGLLFLEAIIQFFDSYLTNWLGQTVIRNIRVDLYQHIIYLRTKYFDNTPIGTLVTRVISDIETIADIFSQGLVVIMGDILKLVVIIAVMFYTNVMLTWISLSVIPFLLFATYIFKNAIKSTFQEVRIQVARLNAFVQEHITGISIIQVFNKEQQEMEKFKAINEKHRDAHIRSVWYYSIFFPVVEILASISLGLLVWWGGRGVLQGKVTTGELVAFIMYLNMLFRPIRQLADRFNTLQMGIVSLERVFQVMNTHVQIEDIGTLSANKINGDIEFRNVWFAYNNEDWVLKNFSFTAKKGETIALVGATGAGKSSVINLLSRFYEYNKGNILIDGNDIREYKLDSLRRNIAIVLQDVFLFSDTITNNITLNNKEISFDEVLEASKIVGADEFIQKLPKQYDFEVMEKGAMLSVGQRQLISFIRAYIYNPSILILDEATSSIDTESEKMIQNAIEKLTKNRTSIIIAHRLTTIQKADKIILLDHGQIIESGNHQELLKKNGQYKKLFDLQFKNEN